MRYRENSEQELTRARAAVGTWHQQHPDGTADEMLAAIGGGFHPDYGPVLRACLYRLRADGPQAAAGITIITGQDR